MYDFETLSHVTKQPMGAIGITGTNNESIRTCFQGLDYFTLDTPKARKTFEGAKFEKFIN